ncbi:MAG: GAF domain-containing protein [Candidatus Xenobiia bacterium LiM19]
MTKKTTTLGMCDLFLSFMSDDSIDGLLKDIVHRYSEFFELKGALIRLVDKQWKNLLMGAHYGLSDEYINKGPVSMDNNIIDREVSEGKTVFIRNVAKEPAVVYPAMLKKEGIHSVICLPLKSKTRFLGILRGYTSKVRDFTTEEIESMEKLATVCAVAIENLITRDRERKHVEFTHKVNFSLDLEDTLKTLVRLVTEVMNVKACTIRLLDEQNQKMVTKAVWGLTEAFLKKGPHDLDKLKIDQVVLQGETLYIPDVTIDPRFMYPEEAVKEEIVSLLSVPLRTMDKSLGTMRIYTAHEYEFSESEKNFLLTLANEGATALNNAILYKRLHTIFEVTTSLTRSLELRQVFKTIAEGAISTVNAQGCAIFTWDIEKREFELAEIRGVSREFLMVMKQEYIDCSPEVVQGKRVIKGHLDSDFNQRCLKAAEREGIRSFINVPMKAKEHPIGIIQLYFTSLREIAGDEVDFIVAMANEAAVAIENATLYDALNKKYDHLVENIFLSYDGPTRGMEY